MAIDKKLAVAGATLGVALSIYLALSGKAAIFVTTSALATLAFGLYLVFQRFAAVVTRRVVSKRTAIFLDFGFLLFFVAAIGSYVLREGSYGRPLSFYILAGLVIGILAVQITLTELKGKRIYITLCQIIAVGILLEWTITLMSPTLVGLDPWWHRWYTLKIISDGGIETIQQLLPVYHFVVAGTMEMTGLDYRLATMASVSLAHIVADVLLIYGIAKMAFNRRIAVMSALLMTLSGWHIWFGYWTVPNTLGATLALVVLYFAIRWYKNKRIWELAASLVSFGLVLFTHPFATIWAAVGVGLYFGAVIVHKIIAHRKVHIPVSLLIVIVVVVSSMAFMWTTEMGYLTKFKVFATEQFKPTVVGYSYSPAPVPVVVNPPTKTTSPLPVEDNVVADDIPRESIVPLYDETWKAGSYWETLFNSSGMFLYFAVSIAGCLYAVKRWRRRIGGVYIAVFGFLILAIGYFPMLFGMSVIEHRWWYFAQMLLSVPLALVVLWLAYSARRLWVRASVVGFAVALLAFLMSVGLPVNMDNYTFSKNQLARYALTELEVQAVYDIDKMYPDCKMATDSFYTMSISHLLDCMLTADQKVNEISKNFLSGDFNSIDADIILIRSVIVESPFGSGNGVMYRLNYDPRLVLVKQGFVKVYDNGEVSSFERKP